MRKLQIFCTKNADDLMKKVNEYFEKLDRLGYKVIKTDYSEGMYNFTAYIEYEKKAK